jgi:uncharacterized membrane protein YhaH (DUF805 family)
MESVIDWMLLPLKRYADFSGRSRRKEYWFFTLGCAIAGFIAGIVENILGLSGSVGPYGFLSILLILALFLPSLSVSVRRLHDQDKSGWFLLIALIPIIGSVVILVFMCLPGTPGPNRFGPDPMGIDPGVFS